MGTAGGCRSATAAVPAARAARAVRGREARPERPPIDGRVLAPGDAVQFLLQRAGGAEWSDAVVAAVGAAWCEVRITRTATTRRVAFDGSPLKLRLAPA
eukprot:gene39446-30895_t